MKLKIPNYFSYSVFILFVLISCIPISYIGDTFPPTNKIDTFYSSNEIKTEHKVIGHILGSGDDINSIKEKLKKEGMQKGANAILFSDIDFEDTKYGKTNKVNASLIVYTN